MWRKFQTTPLESICFMSLLLFKISLHYFWNNFNGQFTEHVRICFVFERHKTLFHRISKRIATVFCLFIQFPGHKIHLKHLKPKMTWTSTREKKCLSFWSWRSAWKTQKKDFMSKICWERARNLNLSALCCAIWRSKNYNNSEAFKVQRLIVKIMMSALSRKINLASSANLLFPINLINSLALLYYGPY